MKGVWLVARRELRQQLRSKGFLISTVVSALAIAAFILVPSLLDSDSEYRVDVVDAPGFAATLEDLAEQAEVELSTNETDEEQARRAVEEGDADAAVLGGSTVLTEGSPADDLAVLIDRAHEAVSVEQQILDSGLPVDQVVAAVTVEPLERETLGDSADEDARRLLALIIMVALLFLLMTTTLNVAGGVIEEKGSRIVEILLVAVTARQMLAGKLLGFGVLGLVQLVVFSAAGVGAAVGIGLTDDLPAGWPGVIAATFGGYVLGFLFFGAMAAAFASLTSRQEELNSTQTPLTALLVMTYFAAFLAIGDPDSLLARLAAIIPPFSSMAMPVAMASGEVGVTEVLTSVGLMAVAIVAILLTGARIYERSVLRTGGRVKLSEALKDGDRGQDDRPGEDATVGAGSGGESR